MLGECITKYKANVYLVNTGWSGGPAGEVPRMSIKFTRAIITAALNGELEKGEFELDPIFNVMVPGPPARRPRRECSLRAKHGRLRRRTT
jgi:phosphoenolpyruvate carboxykinase (ATP)